MARLPLWGHSWGHLCGPVPGWDLGTHSPGSSPGPGPQGFRKRGGGPLQGERGSHDLTPHWVWRGRLPVVKLGLGLTRTLWAGRTACPSPAPTHSLGLSSSHEEPRHDHRAVRSSGQAPRDPAADAFLAHLWRAWASGEDLQRLLGSCGAHPAPQISRVDSGLDMAGPAGRRGQGWTPVGRRVLRAPPPRARRPCSLSGGGSSVQRDLEPSNEPVAPRASPGGAEVPTEEEKRHTEVVDGESQQRRALSARPP